MRLRAFSLSDKTGCGPVLPRTRVATIGNFDGIHRGHQEVIRSVVAQARARAATATVISFHPHPSLVLGRASEARYLYSLRQKLGLLRQVGVDELVLIHFTAEIREMSAEQFVEKVLIERLRSVHFVLGYDTRLGKGRAGDAALITEVLQRHGCSAEMIARLDDAAVVVSSRRIRSAIEQGEIDTAHALLGRRYALEGRVVKGDGRGRTIGVPTANLHIQQQLLPSAGVYAGIATVRDARLPAVANIGYRPTFSADTRGAPKVEVHLLANGSDVYGEKIGFELVKRLRGEQKFASVPALVQQIATDCEHARILLKSFT